MGVELADGIVHADRVILAAGAIGSPAILLRSGIGPADDLAALGIAVLVDLPGVGAQVWDHPAAPLWLVPRPGAGDPSAPYFQMLARYTDHGESDSSAMAFIFAGCTDVTSLPGVYAAVGGPLAFELDTVLMQPRAAGRLTLQSADPLRQPAIDLRFASDPEDLRRLMEGLRHAWDIAHRPELAPLVARVAGLAAAELAAETALAAYVRTTVGSFCHALGTAPMGRAGNAWAVVDERCRVHGVGNLWVADAAVMPMPR